MASKTVMVVYGVRTDGGWRGQLLKRVPSRWSTLGVGDCDAAGILPIVCMYHTNPITIPITIHSCTLWSYNIVYAVIRLCWILLIKLNSTIMLIIYCINRCYTDTFSHIVIMYYICIPFLYKLKTGFWL